MALPIIQDTDCRIVYEGIETGLNCRTTEVIESNGKKKRVEYVTYASDLDGDHKIDMVVPNFQLSAPQSTRVYTFVSEQTMKEYDACKKKLSQCRLAIASEVSDYQGLYDRVFKQANTVFNTLQSALGGGKYQMNDSNKRYFTFGDPAGKKYAARIFAYYDGPIPRIDELLVYEVDATENVGKKLINLPQKILEQLKPEDQDKLLRLWLRLDRF